jgi:TonB-linked SusC/RagA family outer membrane protein
MRKILRFLTGFCAFLILNLEMHAQDVTITGKVTNNENEPLQGVNVNVKKTSRAVITDNSGVFSIKAAKGNVLVITSVGFLKREVTVGDNPVINVTLPTDTRNLSEIVVTSFGIKKEKRGLPTSSQELKGAEVAGTQRENFLNSIQGRVAGATVNTTSGAPGASTQIVLRGFNSISGSNSPLIVVDGLRINNNSFDQHLLASNLDNRNNDYTNRAADINPEDIESINILKGPEATALYGIEAGSGAIIITTKKPRTGKIKVGYDNNFRISHVFRFPEVQTVYDNGLNGAPVSAGTRSLFGPRYAPGTKLYDNITGFFQNGFAQKHNLNLEGGGSQRMSMRGSLTYRNEHGVVRNTGLEIMSGRFSLNNKPSRKIEINTSIAYTYSKNDKAFRGAAGFLQNLLLWPQDDDATNFLLTDGKRRKLLTGTTAELDNPYFDINKNKSFDITHRAFFNNSSSFDPTSWWNITTRFGADFYSQYGNSFIHPESNSAFTVGGQVEDYNESYLSLNSVFISTFKKNIGKFKNTLRIGFSNDEWSRKDFSTRGQRLRDSITNKLSNATVFATSRNTGADTLTRKRLQGVFGEYNINYNEIIYLNFTGRNDWTSTLPVIARSFFYPSAGISFIFSDLIAPNSTILNFGKLRASYAETAKDISPYGSQSWYTNAPGQSNGYGWVYDFYNNNPLIKPERQKSFEVGTELRFLNNRFNIEAAYYKTKNIGQIVRLVRLSYGTGFVLNTSNISDTRNTGVEVSLNTTPVRGKNFTWKLNFNFNKMENRITSLPSNIPEFYNSDTWLGNFRAGLTRNGTITQLTGQDYLRNTAGQIIIDGASGYPLADANYTKIGDRNPDFQLGIINNLRYKNLSLSFLFDIKRGGDILNANEIWLTQTGLSTRTLNREKPIIIQGVLNDGLQNTANPTPNTIQIVPMFQSAFYTDRTYAVDYVEHDVDWLRLRDMTLMYDLGPNMLRKWRIFSSFGIFVTGTDLLLFTNYSGVDPTAAGNSAATLGSGSFGIDYGSLSTPRGINFGIKAQFANK